MAQATHTLLQELIKAHDILSTGVDGARVKENALSLLSDTSSGRTNQFEVKARLEGLVEKCRILNNDPLGNALQTRLDKLPTVSNNWTPEVLSLLLSLSDRPVRKTRLEDLTLSQPEKPSAPLTWEEIIKEDPLEDQTAIWRDIDFTADGSDENADVRSALSESSFDENGLQGYWTENSELDLEALVVAVNKNALEVVSDAHNWREDAPNRGEDELHEKKDVFEVTELVAIREVIFMLLGLPTSIFEEDRNGNCRTKRNVRLCNVSEESVADLLDSFQGLGQKLCRLRHWIKAETDVPLEQSFRFALEARLKLFHSTLDALQMRILDNSHATVASLLAVYNEVHDSSRLIVQLHDILMALVPVEAALRPFELLQSLYSHTCTNQKDSDDEGYEYMARIFFQCFRTYLKPILAWMETGETSEQSRIMLIEKSNEEVSPHSLWQDQYRLVYNGDGVLKAPRFLHVAAKKIFNTGKSVHFLKKLGFNEPARIIQPNIEPLITYEAVCLMADPRNLSPFSELFHTALARWIASKHHSSSSHLRDRLESQCGLRGALSALEYIYFYYNGALSSNAVFPLFERIERAKRPLNDAFTTTELFNKAFASVDCIDLDRLSVRSTTSVHASNSKQRSMSILKSLSVSYLLPWPVANIIRPKSMPAYQRIFILLTQVLRAKYLLQRFKLLVNASSHSYAVHVNLLWFVNTLLSHLTTLVIAVNTAQMRRDLSNAEDVDAMIAVHEAYIAKLEDQCFLTKQHISLYQAVISILDLAVLFSDMQDTQAQHTSTGRVPEKRRSESVSSSDEEDEATKETTPVIHPGNQRPGKLVQIYDTYIQLLTIATAAVEGASKADGSSVWEILAGNLAFGTVG